MIQPDAGDFLKAHFLCGNQPPVTLHNDVIVTPYADRIIEPVRFYAGLDLFNVIRGVSPCVVFIGCQCVNW
jgi:hypothetical protein